MRNQRISNFGRSILEMFREEHEKKLHESLEFFYQNNLITIQEYFKIIKRYNKLDNSQAKPEILKEER